MKYTISLIALMAALACGTAYARGMNTAQQHYGGTGMGPGGFASKTGFVKERTNEEDQMGKDQSADSDAKQAPSAGDEPSEGDVPSSAEGSDDDSNRSGDDSGED